MISIQLNWDPFLSRLRLRALPRNFSLSPKNPTPALQAIIWGLKKYSFCNPYDLFTICAIRRCVDYKQVLFCFVLETGIQRTLTGNPDQGHGSIPISWELRKFLFFRETLDFLWGRCWQGLGWRGGTRGGGGNSPRKRPGYSSSRFYRGEKLQISASLVVCRTESMINSSWEPRLCKKQTNKSKKTGWGNYKNSREVLRKLN